MSPHPATQVPGLVTKRSPSPNTHSVHLFICSLRKRVADARTQEARRRESPPGPQRPAPGLSRPGDQRAPQAAGRGSAPGPAGAQLPGSPAPSVPPSQRGRLSPAAEGTAQQAGLCLGGGAHSSGCPPADARRVSRSDFNSANVTFPKQGVSHAPRPVTPAAWVMAPACPF